jgi:hypothetical protein
MDHRQKPSDFIQSYTLNSSCENQTKQRKYRISVMLWCRFEAQLPYCVLETWIEQAVKVKLWTIILLVKFNMRHVTLHVSLVFQFLPIQKNMSFKLNSLWFFTSNDPYHQFPHSTPLALCSLKGKNLAE